MSQPRRTLSPFHREQQLPGIPNDTVDELQFYTEVDPEEVARDLNIDMNGEDADKLLAWIQDTVPILAMPFPGTDGYVIFRHDEPRVSGAWESHNKTWVVDAPDGRTLPANGMVKGAYLKHIHAGDEGRRVRYECPRDTPVPLYVPSRFRNRRHPGPLYVHEAVKKAAAGHGLGMNSVGLGGVYNWRAPAAQNIASGESTPSVKAELLEECQAAGNEAIIVFDTPDMTQHAGVIAEAVSLARALADEGVSVQIAYVPTVKNGVKAGFDDWVAAAKPMPSEVRAQLRVRPAHPAQALEWAKQAKKVTALVVKELSTWAYLWLRKDKALFEKWVKSAVKALEIPSDTFEQVVEHLSKADEVDLVAYDVRSDAYLLRHSTDRPFPQWTGTRTAAQVHLVEVGRMTARAASKAVAAHAMPIVYGRDCRPGSDFIFKNSGGETIANTYVPPKLLPAHGGGWPAINRLLDGLTNGDANGKKWLIHWLAYKVQNPGARMNTAVVFQGAPGWGKDTLVRAMRYILGEENTTTISQNDLDSSFNDYADKLFVFADEVLNRENVNDKSGPLKAYLASSVVRVNPKGRPAYQVDNRSAWIFATNSPNPVKLERNDRRYTVFAHFGTPSVDHINTVGGMWKNGSDFTDDAMAEVAHWAWFLLMEVKPDYNLIKRPYENQARADLMDVNKNSVEVFADVIEDVGVVAVCQRYLVGDTGSWDFGDRGIAADALYAAYTSWCPGAGYKHAVSNKNFGAELRRRFPDLAPRDESRIRARDGGDRVYVYKGLPRAQRSPGLSLVPAEPADTVGVVVPISGLALS